ncbi:unnamed protein product, partial [Chrysoparadoxa australica]
YSFRGLWDEAGYIAYRLKNEWKVKKGDRVVLCYTPGRYFFAAFLGCLRAGVVAALVYPPNPSNLEKDLKKLQRVVENCTPVLFLVDSLVSKLRMLGRVNFMSSTRRLWPSLPFRRTDDGFKWPCLHGTCTHTARSLPPIRIFDEPSLEESDLAFLQYTSGSTGDPKGVMVSYANLCHNVEYIIASHAGGDTGTVGFSWLPQYHDLGLIYCAVAPFCGGYTQHFMSPITFIKRPLLWLELMGREGCTWTAAPDFGYRLCVRKYMEAAEPKPRWDLSPIRQLHSAAEPIRTTTVSGFESCFRSMGLPEDWFVGCYGLAESVVGVAWVHGLYFSKSNPELICTGIPKNLAPSNIDLRVVDPETMEEKADGETGEIWLSSGSVTGGYYGKPEASEAAYGQRIKGSDSDKSYLRTGDLAYWEEGRLFICGRQKDLIICRGRNVYPQDIEFAVQDASPAVRPGCIAAFSSDETGGDGELEVELVVFEIRASHEPSVSAVMADIHAAVLRDSGLSLRRIAAVKERSIPKTTSGKIRRRATRSALHEDELKVV